MSTNGPETSPVLGTIRIPVEIAMGTSRMRVTIRKEAFVNPCETFDFGEVED